MFLKTMEEFPCPLERTVASALLLLSTATPPSISPPDGKCKSGCSEKSLALSYSKSSSSSVTRDGGSSAETRAHPLRMIAVVARCQEMKLKVVRKSRSKRFDYRQIISGGQPAEASWGCASETTEASSCVSSSTTAISSARSVSGKKAALARDLNKKPPVNSALMRCRSEAIIRLLSNGCASEVKIRQLLGDRPDTSKALRMLLKQEEVKRSGRGGRTDPFIYMIA